MSWKLFFQIVTLLIFTGLIGYLVCPKYDFLGSRMLKGNKYTGQAIYWNEDSKGWFDVP